MAAQSLTGQIKNQRTKSFLKNILCLLTIFSNINMLDGLCKFEDIGELLRNLAVDLSSAFETEINLFWKAYENSFLESILNFINGIITSHSSVTEWIFAIPIVHYLTGQHNKLNSVGWNEDPSKFK